MDTKDNIKEEKIDKNKSTKKTSSSNSKKSTPTAKKTDKKRSAQDKKEGTKKTTNNTKKIIPKKNTAVKKESKTSIEKEAEKKPAAKKTNSKTAKVAKQETKKEKINKVEAKVKEPKEKSSSKKSTSVKNDNKKDTKKTNKKVVKENTTNKEEKEKIKKSSTKQTNKKNTKKNETKVKANNKTKTKETKNIKKKQEEKKEEIIVIKKEKESEPLLKEENKNKVNLKENIFFKKISLLCKKTKDKFLSKKQEKNNTKEEKDPEKKKKQIITLSLFLVFFIILCISSYNIYKWYDSFKRTEKQINDAQKMVEIIEKEDSENTVIVEQEQEINLENPYWNFISMNLMDVNFSKLKEINNQTIGWIKVPGTNVNYPFVQTDNNDFYLYHSFDQSYNDAGWVFMDYRNSLTEMSKNTILYAHGRYDNTMFGSLRHIHNNGWLNDSNNFVIMLSTDYENTLWQIFSTYTIPTTNDYIKSEFTSDEDFINFVNKIKERSIFDFNTPVTASDNILTLSTCYDDYSKMVIHAKLIKKEAKQ